MWIYRLSKKHRFQSTVYHIVKGDIVPIIMGSKSCIPPLHLQRPLPGPGFLQPDPFGLGILPPPGVFPFDKLPPPEIMEQKLAAQHVEMQRLALENEIMEQKLAAQHVEMQRLALENESFAATHYSSRKELSAAQQELQRLQTDMGAIRADQEQQICSRLVQKLRAW
ncbi:protein FLX-like 2 isoform X2 [Musa acuminata AAA Group]|uniref:protein FLX-like 2 isoform X2 n=1 Tax=Musa acuminata AAA Group TaxID=214697 RepID=UPI0031DC0A2B